MNTLYLIVRNRISNLGKLALSLDCFHQNGIRQFFFFSTSIARLEEENSRLYSQVKVLMEEREEDQKRIRDLVDEVAKLSLEKQERFDIYEIMLLRHKKRELCSLIVQL